MKILSVCIPCYDTTNKLGEAIESCLILKEDIEVIVVANREEDSLAIAYEYATKYPMDVKVLVKEDIAILQMGINNATGLYFKILDGDDSFDASVLVKVVETFKDLLGIQANLDMMICDYQFSKKAKKKEIKSYDNVLPLDRIFQWHQTKQFHSNQALTMQAIIFKTNSIKKLDLGDSNTSYLEQILIIQALQKIKCMYYLNQSLQYVHNKASEVEYADSLDECIHMSKQIINILDLSTIESRKLRNYLASYVSKMIVQCIVLLIKQRTMESKVKRDDVLMYLQSNNYVLYKYMKKTTIGKIAFSDRKIVHRLLVRRTKLDK